MLDCVGAFSLLVLGRGEAEVRFGKIRLQINRPLIALASFGEFPLLLQDVAQIIVWQAKVGSS